MYETSEIRKGLKILVDGQPHVVVEFQFVKPGKGRPFTRTRVKSLITGRVLEKTYFSGERIERAELEEKQMQYLYPESGNYCFMDTTSYEQVHISGDIVGESKNFLVENLVCSLLFFEERAVGVTLPTFVDLLITHCEPGVRGDTASGAQKPATLSTGHTINVPLFVNEGEWVRIDTRNGEYVERVKR